MHITPKVADALRIAYARPDRTLVRRGGGFRDPGFAGTALEAHHTITRRTANMLVNSLLAEFNARDVPSSITLTGRGAEAALRGWVADVSRCQAGAA